LACNNDSEKDIQKPGDDEITVENEKDNKNEFEPPPSTSYAKQLYKVSEKLLKPHPPAQIDTLTATIFDLRLQDRKRVSEMITELALTTENLAQLQENYDVISAREAKYYSKSSQLMKKVDVLNEKCQKLEDEKVQMKEKHFESLTTLNNTVTNISNQFESSVTEMKTMAENNLVLQQENKRLREKIIELEINVDTLEKTNHHLSVNLFEKQEKPSKKKHRSKSQNQKHTKKSGKDVITIKSAPPTLVNSTEEEILHDLFFRF
jgi:chromosome segregation ATPase